MTKCLNCKHFEPLYKEAEFAAARLRNKKNTYLAIKCNQPSEKQTDYSVPLSFLTNEHRTPCHQYEKLP